MKSRFSKLSSCFIYSAPRFSVLAKQEVVQVTQVIADREKVTNQNLNL